MRECAITYTNRYNYAPPDGAESGFRRVSVQAPAALLFAESARNGTGYAAGRERTQHLVQTGAPKKITGRRPFRAGGAMRAADDSSPREFMHSDERTPHGTAKSAAGIYN